MPRYIFITSVERLEASQPIIEIGNSGVVGRSDFRPRTFSKRADFYTETETIEAREFRTPDGRRLFIGLCREAQATIGVWLESFQSLQKGFSWLHSRCARLLEEKGDLQEEKDEIHRYKVNLEINNEILNYKLNFYRNMNFWQRLRFLFKIW